MRIFIHIANKLTLSFHICLLPFSSLSMNTFMSERGPEAFINPFSLELRRMCVCVCVCGHESSITLTLYLQEETLQTAGGGWEKCVSVCRAWPKKGLLCIRIDNWYSICHRANNGRHQRWCHFSNNKINRFWRFHSVCGFKGPLKRLETYSHI